MGDQMNKAYQSNMKQLKRESKRQSYMQKDRDEQILKRLETIEKAVGQMNGYLARLTSYVDACTQDSKEAILQALREHDKKTDKTGLQNREVLKLLLSNSLIDTLLLDGRKTGTWHWTMMFQAICFPASRWPQAALADKPHLSILLPQRVQTGIRSLTSRYRKVYPAGGP